MNKANIIGVGIWEPSHIRNNDFWSKDFGANKKNQDRTFNDIPARADADYMMRHYLGLEQSDPFLGAIERRVADDSVSSVDAETNAALEAINNASIDPADIDVIISYSMVPDRLMPSNSCATANKLGSKKAMTFSIDGACASTIPQLATAKSFIESGAAKNVLITQSHLMLRSFPINHPAAPGLGDIATAAVISSEKPGWEIMGVNSITHGDFYSSVTWIRGNDDETDIPWYKSGGDFRLGSRNKEGAKQLMRDTIKFGSETIQDVCNKSNINVSDIDLLISVQPRAWVTKALANNLNLDESVAHSTYEKYAHVGACGPLLNFYDAIKHNKKPNVVALYAQGAGFIRGSALCVNKFI